MDDGTNQKPQTSYMSGEAYRPSVPAHRSCNPAYRLLEVCEQRLARQRIIVIPAKSLS